VVRSFWAVGWVNAIVVDLDGVVFRC
jgi:hypothetical protein